MILHFQRSVFFAEVGLVPNKKGHLKHVPFFIYIITEMFQFKGQSAPVGMIRCFGLLFCLFDAFSISFILPLLLFLSQMPFNALF